MKKPLLGLEYDSNIIKKSFVKDLAGKLSGSKNRKDTYHTYKFSGYSDILTPVKYLLYQ